VASAAAAASPRLVSEWDEAAAVTASQQPAPAPPVSIVIYSLRYLQLECSKQQNCVSLVCFQAQSALKTI